MAAVLSWPINKYKEIIAVCKMKETSLSKYIVLIDCIDLGLIRPRFYNVPDMNTLFDTVSVDRTLSFVKEINLFSNI